MRACEAEIAVVDFESTGAVEGFPNEPWQIGVVLLCGGRVQPDSGFGSLLYIGDRPFNPHAPGRHAALRSQLAEAPSLAQLWSAVSGLLQGRALAAHNAAVERKLLDEAFPLHVLGPWVDTLELAQIAYPRLTGYALDDLICNLGLLARAEQLCPEGGFHDARFDATCCGVLLEHLIGLPHWQGVTVQQLAAARSGRRRSQARSAAAATQSQARTIRRTRR